MSFLQQRLALLREVYGSVLTSHDALSTPESVLATVKANYTRDVALWDPVTSTRIPISDRFVNLSLLHDGGTGGGGGAATLADSHAKSALLRR